MGRDLRTGLAGLVLGLALGLGACFGGSSGDEAAASGAAAGGSGADGAAAAMAPSTGGDGAGAGGAGLPGNAGIPGGSLPGAGAGAGGSAGIAGGSLPGGSGGAGVGGAGMGGAGAGGVAGGPMMPIGGVAGVAPTCAAATVQLTRVTPTVMLVIAAGDSMGSAFDSTTRWAALRDTLLLPDGVLPLLEGRLRLGAMYVGGTVASCPNVYTSGPQTVFSGLSSSYPPSPLGGFLAAAPALTSAYEMLASDPEATDPLLLWIGDDAPRACTDGASDDTDAAAAAIMAGVAQGVDTQVIQLGNDEPVGPASQALATATVRTLVQVSTRADLATALEVLLDGALTCALQLNGRVSLGRECNGVVELNGNQLECNGDNGWRMGDERTLELMGTACDQYRQSADGLVRAQFPCTDFTPD